MVSRGTRSHRGLAEELESFKAVLFDPYGEDYNPKRLLSLFMLARRLGFGVSDEKLEQAHRKELDPQAYKDLFEKVFEVATQQCLSRWPKCIYLPKVHHFVHHEK